MKTVIFPPLCINPELRQAAEEVLREGETLSSFVVQAIRDSVTRRQLRQEFVARGLRSADAARHNGSYVSADVVVGRLEQMLVSAKAKAPK